VTGRTVFAVLALVHPGVVCPSAWLIPFASRTPRSWSFETTTALVAGGVDNEFGFDGDWVDTRELTWEGVDWRPVHDNASDAVVLSNDDVGELGHVLILAPASQAALISAEQAWGPLAVWSPYLLAFLMRHVEFVEHFVGRFADGERVHQEATEPKPPPR